MYFFFFLSFFFFSLFTPPSLFSLLFSLLFSPSHRQSVVLLEPTEVEGRALLHKEKADAIGWSHWKSLFVHDRWIKWDKSEPVTVPRPSSPSLPVFLIIFSLPPIFPSLFLTSRTLRATSSSSRNSRLGGEKLLLFLTV